MQRSFDEALSILLTAPWDCKREEKRTDVLLARYRPPTPIQILFPLLPLDSTSFW